MRDVEMRSSHSELNAAAIAIAIGKCCALRQQEAVIAEKERGRGRARGREKEREKTRTLFMVAARPSRVLTRSSVKRAQPR